MEIYPARPPESPSYRRSAPGEIFSIEHRLQADGCRWRRLLGSQDTPRIYAPFRQEIHPWIHPGAFPWTCKHPMMARPSLIRKCTGKPPLFHNFPSRKISDWRHHHAGTFAVTRTNFRQVFFHKREMKAWKKMIWHRERNVWKWRVQGPKYKFR